MLQSKCLIEVHLGVFIFDHGQEIFCIGFFDCKPSLEQGNSKCMCVCVCMSEQRRINVNKVYIFKGWSRVQKEVTI